MGRQKSTANFKLRWLEQDKDQPETAVFLAKNDFSAGIDIDSHNLNGQNNGCWK